MKILTFISVNFVLLVLPAIGQVNYDYASVAEKKIKSATVYYEDSAKGYSGYFRILFDQAGRIVSIIISDDSENEYLTEEINYDSLGNTICQKSLFRLCTNRDSILCDTLYFEIEMGEYFGCHSIGD